MLNAVGIIPQSRAGPGEGRRGGGAFLAKPPCPSRMAERQRHATLRAERGCDEIRVPKTDQAKLPVILHWRITGETVWRQQRIQDTPQKDF
jgi:hypothetical protein